MDRPPVFVFGFTHGGTNIVMNLLLSHPGLSAVRGELREVFRGRYVEGRLARQARKLTYWRMCRREGHEVFSPRRTAPPSPWRPATCRDVRRVLLGEPRRARRDGENRWRAPGVEYTRAEIEATRFVCKAPDGLAFLSDELRRTFPGARFVGLVRDGYAVCEGKKRRGQDLDVVAAEYDAVCARMMEDAARLEGYGLVRFEDVLRAPRESLARLCGLVGEDSGRIDMVRLQNKPVLRRDGVYERPVEGPDRALVWYPMSGFDSHFDTAVDGSQAARLAAEDIALIGRRAGGSLGRLGYAAPAPRL